jgi:hypothetical protein
MGDAGATIVISEVAKHGLDISPVPVNTAGMTGDQIEQVGQGSYLVNAVGGCNDCHSANPQNPALFLSGGAPFPLDAPFPDGGFNHVVWTRNLTPDPTTGLTLNENQFIVTLRTGRDQRNNAASLMVMPWPAFRWMGTDDMKAIFAYLKAIPAVRNATPPDNKDIVPPFVFDGGYNEGNVWRALPSESLYTGAPATDPNHVLRGLAIQPLAEPSSFTSWTGEQQAQYGRGSYLVNAVAACNDCHTNPDRDQTTLAIKTVDYLTGGHVFTVPPQLAPVIHQTRTMSENLVGPNNGLVHQTTPVPGSFALFDAIITSGTHADDPMPGPLGWPMPWSHFANMTLDDLESVFAYLQNLDNSGVTPDKTTQPLARYCTVATQAVDCPGSGETCHEDPVVGNECVGGGCSSADECGACQTCPGGTHVCTAPSLGDACLTSGR